MKNYIDFIEESYLESSDAPLYHFTTIESLESILYNNSIKRGFFQNPINNTNSYIVSLTRNKDLLIDDKPIRIELETYKLRHNYKIIPYDFFIQSKQEIYPKSNIKRNKEFEFEECILKDINYLHNYLRSINLSTLEELIKLKYIVLDYIESYSTFEITINENPIIIDELF